MAGMRESWLRLSSGAKILLGSAAFGVVGVGPLLLYIAFGPADGNPIGLGLLAMVALPVAAIGIGIGLVVLVMEMFRGGRG